MAADGLSVQVACRVLGVSASGYYAWRKRPLSARAVRHAWLTDRIRVVHAGSRGTYGARRVHAELVLGQGISVGHQAVERLMRVAGIQGLSGRPRYRKSTPQAAASDLVGRKFAREAPDRLWVTDITEHPTREGKVYCAVVLDACSRRIVGWSIDAAPTAALVTNALGMAIDARRPAGSTVIHSDRGSQYGSWAFTQRAREAGLLPSMGAVGTCFDNALMESFWSRVQIELLDRQVWCTRLELATALFEYLEIFHNRQRRHSSLGMLTPLEFEAREGAPATSTVMSTVA
jgi:putative transposase